MWTSSLIGESWSAWMEWCDSEEFANQAGCASWILTPDPAARVYEINSERALIELFDRYPRNMLEGTELEHSPYWSDYRQRTIDPFAFSKDYDALHLTQAAMWALRMESMFIYGWDCESTWWARWAFCDVAGPVKTVRPRNLANV